MTDLIERKDVLKLVDDMASQWAKSTIPLVRERVISAWFLREAIKGMAPNNEQ